MLVIEILKKDTELAAPYLSELESKTEVTTVESKEFTGNGGTIQYLVALTPIVVPIVVALIKSYYKAKSSIKIKVGGIEIQGVNEDTAEEMVTKILEMEKTSAKTTETPGGTIDE